MLGSPTTDLQPISSPTFQRTVPVNSFLSASQVGIEQKLLDDCIFKYINIYYCTQDSVSKQILNCSFHWRIRVALIKLGINSACASSWLQSIICCRLHSFLFLVLAFHDFVGAFCLEHRSKNLNKAPADCTLGCGLQSSSLWICKNLQLK